jgi:hypothetical protein
MEDVAAGRMSVAQIAQRTLHQARDADTAQMHDDALIKPLLQEETEVILTHLPATVHDDKGRMRSDRTA